MSSARDWAPLLEAWYTRITRRQYVHPDPLEFVHAYGDPADQELAGLVAATLAYGNVKAILRSVGAVLERLGERPARFVRDGTPRSLAGAMRGLRHRWTGADELAALLAGARRAARRSGSLGACFRAGLSPTDADVLGALRAFVGELGARGAAGRLLPDPARGSACKRLHLYLRWMVRRDAVDVGAWPDVPPRLLLVPLDVHMHALARAMGLTGRRAADGRTVQEVTAAFRTVRADDPVRYDFCLTRLGLHPAARPCEFLAMCGRRRPRRKRILGQQ